MKYFDSKGRPVDITETDGGYEEAYVVSAGYLDVDPNLPKEEYFALSEVPENELEYLTDTYGGVICDIEYQKMVMAAEDAYDSACDR